MFLDSKWHKKTLIEKKTQHKISTPVEIQPTDNAQTTTESQPIRNPPTNVQDQPVANPTRFRKDLLYRKMMTYYQTASNFTNRIQNFTNNGSYKIIMTCVGFFVLCWLSTYTGKNAMITEPFLQRI